MDWKKIIIFFVLISFFCFNIYSVDITKYDYIKLKVDNEINFDVEKEDNFKLNYLKLNSYFFPQLVESQYLNSFESSNEDYNLINNSGTYYLLYSFDTNSVKEHNTIINTFYIESTVFRPKINTKVKFPLNYVGNKYSEYLDFDEYIDIDNDIRARASKLAENEDDVFIIASKIAKWIQEDINYDLSTLTQNPNQASSEVFKSKLGVCREITNLYISMMRALGIPARVVSGYAYTDSEDLVSLLGDNWGGHAWAEVLIGNTWVPFDLTYNEYGYVDSTHIMLDKYKSLRLGSTSLNGSGSGFKLVSGSLVSKPDFKILDYKENIYDLGFDISVDGPTEVGLGSYGYIRVKIKNKDNYYKNIFLNLAKTKDTELLDNNGRRMVIFKPLEEKEIYYRYKLPEMDPGFRYTFPFNVYNNYINYEFDVSMQEDYISIKKIALPEEKEEVNEIKVNKLDTNCNYIYFGLDNLVSCSFTNSNNFEISTLKICNDDDCKRISLKIGETKYLNFTTSKESGTIEYNYVRENGSVIYDFEMPKLEYDWKINEDKLHIDYTINNYFNEMYLDIYVNDALVKTTNSKNGLLVFLLNSGKNKIRFEGKSNDSNFFIETFNVSVNLDTLDRENLVTGDSISGEEIGFFEYLIQYLLSFFK